MQESNVTQKWPPLDFSDIGQPMLISEQFSFTEGPLWDRTGNVLLFSDISGNTIYKLTLPDTIDILRTPSNNANGLAFDIEDQLLAAEHGSRSVTRMLRDGTIENLVDNYMGKALNSPNDLVVRSDGTIYFTDPTFGRAGIPPKRGHRAVGYIDYGRLFKEAWMQGARTLRERGVLSPMSQ